MSNKHKIGDRFGKLVVIGDAEKYVTKGGYQYKIFLCACDCGGTCKARATLLTNGKTHHCGCIYTSKTGVMHPRHDQYNSKMHHTWFAMKQRCSNPKNISYSNYGARGVTYCEQWETFDGFHKEMSESYVEGWSLDRINPEGNYNKENCRWAPSDVQAYNKRKAPVNKSGKTGVHWDKKSRKWRVKIKNPSGATETIWFEYLWDAVFERMLLEQKYYGYVKE